MTACETLVADIDGKRVHIEIDHRKKTVAVSLWDSALEEFLGTQVFGLNAFSGSFLAWHEESKVFILRRFADSCDVSLPPNRHVA